MNLDVATLEKLLAAQEHESCERLAARLLDQPGLAQADRAHGYLVLGRARLGLQHYARAIEPLTNAVYLAKEGGLFDIFAKGMNFLGYAYFYCGHHAESVRAYEEFLEHEDRYSEKIRAKVPHVRFNLGTALSAVGRNADAMACFEMAWEVLRDGPDVEMANSVRSNLLNSYLRANELTKAHLLLAAGEAFLREHPDAKGARIEHHIDSARYHYRNGNLRSAHETAVHGLPLVTDAHSQRSQLNLIIARVALAEQRPRDALAAALFAKRDAEKAQRDDMVAQTIACLDEINLRYGQEVLDFVRETTGFESEEGR